MSFTVQEVKHLTLRQCLALRGSNYYAASSQTEYCQFAIEARIVELKDKQAKKYEKSAQARVDEFNAYSNALPPMPNKHRGTKRKQLTEVKFSFSGPIWNELSPVSREYWALTIKGVKHV